MEIGQKLQQLRKQHQISQEQLATILNISRQTISRWESSLTSPDIETIQKICKYYHISIYEFLEEPKPKRLLLPSLLIVLSILFIFISFFIPSHTNQITSAMTFSLSTIILIFGFIGIMISCVLFYKSKKR